MNPVYPLRRRFWDAWNLRTEARKVKDNALKFPYTLPELQKFRDNFLEDHPMDWGEIAVSYMYIDSEYPWHVDDEVTKRGNAKGTQCAINIILEGHNAAVEYENGKYIYEAAVLNTSELHRIIPVDERVMARISFKDKTFKEVVEGIESWQGKNI
jgi:hypothetical protein